MSLERDVVVFDFDGTLVSRDSVLDFCFRYAARRPHRLLLVLLVAPLAGVYRLRSVGAAASVLLWALTVGASPRGFVLALRRYAERVLPRFAYEDTFAQLSQELGRGRRVVLATGALPALVRGVLRARRLPPLPVVGSRLRRRYGGFVVATHCVGRVKPQELARRLDLHRWDAVYTDSWADVDLMRGARHLTLVSPAPRLLSRVQRLSGERTLRVLKPARQAGTRRAGPEAQMLPVRRWSKRRLVLTVLGLVLATAVLTVGMVGFARSIGFVTRIGVASDVLNDATQISPDITTSGGASATPGAPASGGSGTPVAAAQDSPPNPLSSGGVRGSAAPLPAPGGSAGAAETAGGAGGLGGGGAGGVAGAAGTEAAAGSGGAPSAWDGVLQSMLTLLGQSTTQMCGPNTCNAGLVCCNISCGTCVAPGGTCDQTVCAGAARAPTAVRCGSGLCNDGQVCCNPSCGICAAPGETCSSQTCP